MRLVRRYCVMLVLSLSCFKGFLRRFTFYKIMWQKSGRLPFRLSCSEGSEFEPRSGGQPSRKDYRPQKTTACLLSLRATVSYISWGLCGWQNFVKLAKKPAANETVTWEIKPYFYKFTSNASTWIVDRWIVEILLLSFKVFITVIIINIICYHFYSGYLQLRTWNITVCLVYTVTAILWLNLGNINCIIIIIIIIIII